LHELYYNSIANTEDGV